MSRWKVAVRSSDLHKFPAGTFDKLEKKCDVTYWKVQTKPTKQEIIKLISGKQAVLCFDAIDREVIESSPSLRIIANNAVGFDNIDLQATREHKVIVTNTPNVLN